MKKVLKTVLALVVLALLAIQLVPADRTNPPVRSDFDEDPQVEAILRRACYDCHSNETRWPWYSRVAPVSWLVASDVSEGRAKFNLSAWGELDACRKERLREEMVEEVESGDMPLPMYRRAHPDAKLETADVERLRQWGGEKESGRVDEGDAGVGGGRGRGRGRGRD